MKTMCPPCYHPQWFCSNSYTWAHDVQLEIAGEPKSAQSVKQGAQCKGS